VTDTVQITWDTKPVLTTQEVAELLGVSTRTVQRYVHAHELAAIRVGRERRFRASDVISFLEGRPTTVRARKRRRRRPVGDCRGT